MPQYALLCHVTDYDVWRAAGRLLGGYLPERMLHNFGTPRTLSMICAPACMLLTMMLCAWSQPGLIYFVSLLGGTRPQHIYVARTECHAVHSGHTWTLDKVEFIVQSLLLFRLSNSKQASLGHRVDAMLEASTSVATTSPFYC